MSLSSEGSIMCQSPCTDLTSEGLSQLSMDEVPELHAKECEKSEMNDGTVPALISSLFPNVPPVINFCTSDQKSIEIIKICRR